MNEITHIPSEITRRKDNFPYPAPFILSSMERWLCGKDDPNHKPTPENVVYIKRRHLEENIKVIEQEIGMDEAERKRFLDYWCSPSTREPSEIRAELDECFNLRARAESWMERARPAGAQPKSRLERFAESAQQFARNVQQQQTIPTSPAGTQGFGYADIPDEQ